jgi:hypothetical protein
VRLKKGNMESRKDERSPVYYEERLVLQKAITVEERRWAFVPKEFYHLRLKVFGSVTIEFFSPNKMKIIWYILNYKTSLLITKLKSLKAFES